MARIRSFQSLFLYMVVVLQTFALAYLILSRRSVTGSGDGGLDHDPLFPTLAPLAVLPTLAPTPMKEEPEQTDVVLNTNVKMRPGICGAAREYITSDTISKADQLVFCPEYHGYDIMVASMYAPIEVKALDVTWTMQFTVDRLAVFGLLLERWKGPVSAVIYTTNLEDDLMAVYRYSKRVDFHFVLGGQGLYPVNVLRNCAMDKVRSDHFIIVDVDFLPNLDAYDKVMSNLPQWTQQKQNVYILPAFQLQQTGTVQLEIPNDKATLLAMYDTHQISQVHPDPGRKIAHDRCNYDKWLHATESYKVEYGFPFEPYFIAHKSIPRFDPRFIGYGNDKAVHCFEMNAANISFMVWPEGYVVHKDHAPGDWFFKTYTTFDARMKKVMDGFWVDMPRRYNQQPYTPPTKEDNVLLVAGVRGANCDETCSIRGLTCDASKERFVNHCDAMEHKFLCMAGCTNNVVGNDIPAFDIPQDLCVTTKDRGEYPFQCSASHPNTARLCPCTGTPFEIGQ